MVSSKFGAGFGDVKIILSSELIEDIEVQGLWVKSQRKKKQGWVVTSSQDMPR